MEKACPICNALQQVNMRCPRCGGQLADGGALENYYGPYSPYMDIHTLQNCLPETHCVHLLYCGQCRFDTRAAWEMVVI
jgi:hypothetical protein